MDFTFFLLCIPAIVIPLVMKYKFQSTITGKELALNLVVVVAIVAVTVYAGSYTGMGDVELINGQVTGKEQEKVSCSHSYSCNCRTVYSGSGKNRTSSTKCDTCYEHRHDFDWNVYTTVGKFEIDRIDRQGKDMPPRWQIVAAGQPVAKSHYYVNYVRGAKDSLFHTLAEETKYQNSIPAYPQVYDYHYANRVIPVGLNIPNINEWNGRLANALKVLGPEKQANVTIIISKESSPMYAKALKNSWLGGKKNDVTVVIGAPNYPEIAWVDVFSWSKQDIVNVSLRNDLVELKTADAEGVIATITRNVLKHYVRKPMAEFEYLKDNIDPPTWVIILATLFATIGSGLLAWVFHKHDVFGDERTGNSFGSYRRPTRFR